MGSRGQVRGLHPLGDAAVVGTPAAQSFSVAGNALAGPQVIEAVATAYQDQAALPFRRRLLAAMTAGEQAGGDKRGRQSAALWCTTKRSTRCSIFGSLTTSNPLAELARLEGVARQTWIHFRRVLANRKEPHGVLDLGAADTRSPTPSRTVE
jgi:uncharacterized Ntn-hydrolase superfamily protein